jgi:monofunctional biosynthetic peptidoglycan transglycosylase
MDRYAVIGNPVAHSKSPQIHQAFARATGQAMTYERLLAPLDAFVPTVEAFARGGGRGLNVTVPFKLQAFALAEAVSDRAEAAGACNTLERTATGWYADNTDGAGIMHDLTVNLHVPLAGRDVLVLGAGGAARGILVPLFAQSPRSVTIANRSAAKWRGCCAAVARGYLSCRRVRVRHGLRRRTHCFPPLRAAPWRAPFRGRPGHAGRTGGGELPAVARHSPRDGARVRAAAVPALMALVRARPAWIRWVAWGLGLLAAAIALMHVWFAANILWWRDHPVGETAFMTYRLDELREKNPKAQLRYAWVPYGKISGNLKRAMVAAEDAKFVEHEGFDWDGIQLAMEKNQKKGRVVAGGSTITQQLAKNLFLSPVRSYWRKAEEAVITVMLEAMLPKERILEIYLNVIEWGNGIFGAEAAARHYFGVTAAQLSAEQAARLAAMAPNPRFYERNQRAPGLNRKIGIILARMPSADLP